MADFQRCDACPVKDLPNCPAENHARYCILAAKGDAYWLNSIRAKAGKEPMPGPQPALKGPSLFQMALNYARAQIRHTLNGRRLASEEVVAERLATCESCVGPGGYFQASDRRCLYRKCGCFVDEKTQWASESCPIGKWKAIPRD